MPYFKMYEWDLLIFCKQTPFLLAAIGTLTPLTNVHALNPISHLGT